MYLTKLLFVTNANSSDNIIKEICSYSLMIRNRKKGNKLGKKLYSFTPSDMIRFWRPKWFRQILDHSYLNYALVHFALEQDKSWYQKLFWPRAPLKGPKRSFVVVVVLGVVETWVKMEQKNVTKGTINVRKRQSCLKGQKHYFMLFLLHFIAMCGLLRLCMVLYGLCMVIYGLLWPSLAVLWSIMAKYWLD